MDDPEKFITIAFKRQEWYDLLNAAMDSEYESISDDIEATIRYALCPNGHKEYIRYYPQEQRGFGKWNKWDAVCENCGVDLWRIEEQVYGMQRPGNYRYIDWLKDGYPGIIFFPGDESDPRKVDLGKKSD